MKNTARSYLLKILRHLVLWGFLYFIIAVLVSNGQDLLKGFRFSMGKVSICLPIGYFIGYFLIPRLYVKGKKTLFFLYLSLLLVGGVVLLRLYSYYVYFAFYPPPWKTTFWNTMFFVYETVNYYLILFPIVAAIQISQWLKAQRQAVELREKNLELEKEKLSNELKYLKNQINPHFFFNTLNNLYGLALRKSDHTADAIVKLSDIMRYLIYDSDVPLVTISEEIKWLKAYLDLEKMRYGDKVDIQFDHPVIDLNRSIPPMILLHFLENSFKHGVSKNIGRSFVKLSVHTDNHFLYFDLENSLSEKARNDKKGSIGLKNISRRLDLLFAQEYGLEAVKTDKSFIIHLKIPYAQ